MPYVTTDDGVKLYYEDSGHGTPIIFVHEFAGDSRSWSAQIGHFSRKHRCVAFNARGYPPSEIPSNPDAYSQERARDDIRDVLNGIGIDSAHIVGLSMGAFAALHFGIGWPARARSLVVAGCGYGAAPDARPQFISEAESAATRFEELGMAQAAEAYALGPARVQFQNKNPDGWKLFRDQLAEHSATGAARTMRGVQARRPSLYDLAGAMRKMTVPTLVMTGDEDWPCLEPALLLKRTIPSAGLVMLPNTGHTINLEEPDAFNAHVGAFLDKVEANTWPPRDPRAMKGSILSP